MWCWQVLFLIVFEDGFDGSVSGCAKEQGPGTGCFEPEISITIRQPDYPLGRTEMIEYPVGKQLFDELQAGGSDLFRLGQAPLGIAELVGQGIRGHMVV